ncbi:MAG: endonuclease [bacterium]
MAGLLLVSIGCDSAPVQVTPTVPAPAQQAAPIQQPAPVATKPQLTKEKLRAEYGSHQNLSYLEARRHLFSSVDNVNGKVTGVYTGLEITTSKIPDPKVMNTEHSWPQSRLPEAAVSDLHHLFPAKASANMKRSNVYFGNVLMVDWQEGGSKFGDNKNRKKAFEVRPQQRGDTARAMFYISTIYNLEIPPWEEEFLRMWHVEDPVDAREKTRNDAVERIQGNRNPFVDHPEFVAEIPDF